MLERAIVINSYADFPAVEPLARRLDAPVFLRGSLDQLKAKEVYVAGGGLHGISGGNTVIDLSGENRYETAINIYNLLKRL